MMYHIDGGSAFVESSELKPKYGMELRADASTTVQAGDADVRVLIYKADQLPNRLLNTVRL